MKNKLLFGFAAVFCMGIILSSCRNKENDKNGIEAVAPLVLKWEQFSPLITEFNQTDEELYKQYYPNDQVEQFLEQNIPYFNCPDKELEKTYYFRWWTYRKHIKNTPDGFVITEFLPDVSWAGKHNTINCPAGHHFYEGRWLHDQKYLQDYAYFWFRGGGALRSYSFWAANSILAFAQVHKNEMLLTDLLPDFDNNYKEWEKSHLLSDGLFWQVDDRDGMEVSIGGSGKRATINSYMYGDARAIADIASVVGNKKLAKEYAAKAKKLKSLIITKLWDEGDTFFKTLPLDSSELNILKDQRQINTFLGRTRNESGLIDARELHGFTPWYFSIPEDKHSVAWKFLISEKGFKAPYGPTTAEQSHPEFRVVYEGHACQWNGPSWPFSTSITLKSMANLLRDYEQSTITKDDFIQLLRTYSDSHRRIDERGNRICWIDENLNPFTGDWIARTMKTSQNAQPRERGKDYNHSEFCDIIISDLVGLRPSMDDHLTIEPLIPSEYWDWFCLDHINYHNKSITIVWDENGTKYNKGKGFSIFLNGVLVKNSRSLKKIKIKL